MFGGGPDLHPHVPPQQPKREFAPIRRGGRNAIGGRPEAVIAHVRIGRGEQHAQFGRHAGEDQTADAKPWQQRLEIGGVEARMHRLDDEKVRLARARSEEHTSELQSLMRISYAVFCLKKKKKKKKPQTTKCLYKKKDNKIKTKT